MLATLTVTTAASPSTTPAVLAAFLTTVLFAISAVCGARTARVLGGTEANFWRLAFAAVVLGLWAHIFGGGLAGAALPVFVISGCVGFVHKC